MVIFSSIVNFLRRERDYRTTRTLLHAMDDHLLQDIGVRRDQIDSLVAEQRALKREQAAIEAQNQRNSRGSNSTLGGRGLAAQH
ncbi:MAG TPA: DUF1127 domain-containing protein [Rhizobiales bacterium]|nr:DUF1127 domain-containing protein [Hyphomicrobiales bacterium]